MVPRRVVRDLTSTEWVVARIAFSDCSFEQSCGIRIDNDRSPSFEVVHAVTHTERVIAEVVWRDEGVAWNDAAFVDDVSDSLSDEWSDKRSAVGVGSLPIHVNNVNAEGPDVLILPEECTPEQAEKRHDRYGKDEVYAR